MRHSKFVDLAVLVGLIIVMSFWWTISETKNEEDPLNKSDAFVYRDDGLLCWFELTNKKGKVEGTFHQQVIYEEVGRLPLIEEQTYTLTGKTVDQGYELQMDRDGETLTFDAYYSDSNLIVKEQGKKETKIYQAVDAETLHHFIETIQEELEMALYHSEKKEKDRIRSFFNELRGYGGYLYQDESLLLLIKFDEALYEGELSGSLVVLADPGDTTGSYEETRYEINGITDGMMINLYTNVDGKAVKLEGYFHEGASSFDVTFWAADENLTFHAVTEDEFNKSYEEFKR